MTPRYETSAKTVRQESAEWDTRLNDRSNSKDVLLELPSAADAPGSVTKPILNYMDRDLHGQLQELVKVAGSLERARDVMPIAIRLAEGGAVWFKSRDKEMLLDVASKYKQYQGKMIKDYAASAFAPNNLNVPQNSDPNKSGIKDVNSSGKKDPNAEGRNLGRSQARS